MSTDEHRRFDPLPGYVDNQIDYGEFLEILRRQRWVFWSILVVIFLAALTVAFILPKKYEASILLASVADTAENSGLSSLTNQFGGIASIAGLNLDTTGNKEQAIAILSSRELAENFIRDQKLLPVFYSELWDSGSGRWLVDESEIPTMWDATKMFDEDIRRISLRKEDGLIDVSMTWYEPAAAADWGNRLVALANQKMRNDAIAEASQSIEYLNEQLNQTSAIELKQGIYRLIESNMHTTMLANVRDEFAFKVLDMAVAPDLGDFVSPNRPMIVITGLIFGILAGLAGALVRHTSLLRTQERV